MVEPVNLRQFRKQKQREEKAKLAEQNRKFHGISSKLKKQVKVQNQQQTVDLDGKRLDPEK